MLTNFLHALVQSWDSASGQMAPVPPTVWRLWYVCVCILSVCVCVCMRETESVTVCMYGALQVVSKDNLEECFLVSFNAHSIKQCLRKTF